LAFKAVKEYVRKNVLYETLHQEFKSLQSTGAAVFLCYFWLS